MYIGTAYGRRGLGDERDTMTDRGDDIRATAEQLEEDAATLTAIEQAKIELPDGDERVVALSEQAAALTEAMAKTARVQLAIATDAAS